MEYEYTVFIEQDEDGVYIATVPTIRGCHSWGDTMEEALENIREAIQLHIESRQELGEPIPQEAVTRKVRVPA